MNNYYVVATAKHTLNLRGKQYKIGEPVPTELTENEYEFYKDALNVESVSNLQTEKTVNPIDSITVEFSDEELKKIRDKIISEIKAEFLKENPEVKEEELNKIIAKTESKIDTSIKPKRPYAKKETK